MALSTMRPVRQALSRWANGCFKEGRIELGPNEVNGGGEPTPPWTLGFCALLPKSPWRDRDTFGKKHRVASGLMVRCLAGPKRSLSPASFWRICAVQNLRFHQLRGFFGSKRLKSKRTMMTPWHMANWGFPSANVMAPQDRDRLAGDVPSETGIDDQSRGGQHLA